MKSLALKQWLHNLFHSSLGRRFLKKYILLILIPLIAVSIFLSNSLMYIYQRNNLYQQNTYLTSIQQTWNIPENQCRFIMNSMQSSHELLHSLEKNYYTQAERLYAYQKSLHSLFREMLRINDNVSSIKIYSMNPEILQIDPFYTLEADTFPLSEADLDQLRKSKPGEILWITKASEASSAPELYAYYKLYSSTYSSILGYVELKMNMKFLDEYLALLSQNQEKEIGLTLYDEEQHILYEHLPQPLSAKTRLDFVHNDHSYGSQKGIYYFTYSLPEYHLDILVTITGNNLFTIYLFPLAITTFVLIAFLYIMSMLFFREISQLTHRIGSFSKYMDEYDQEQLTLYAEDLSRLPRKKQTAEDEFSALIDAFNQMLKRNNALTTRIHNLELLTRDAKLAAMQAQIHPHFIYGTLETIRMLAVQNDDEEVENIVYSFSKLMRYSLTHPSDKSTISKEIEINRHYMNIQHLRLEDRLCYEETIAPQLPDIHCPPFMIQPLLENAIVHGVSKSLDYCRIQLKAFIHEDSYIIQIIDNANVASDEAIESINYALHHEEARKKDHSDNGFALNNVADRLILFYHGNASLNLYKSGEFTISEIRIQYTEWEGNHVSSNDR